MKPVKGLYIDIRPQDQPEGTYPYGKNGIQHDIAGSVFNEPGFRLLASVVPYKLMGVIETDDKPVLFSTDNTNSAVGYFNPRTESYEPIVDDNPSGLINWPDPASRLDFSTNFYITGQSQRNYKGQLVVAFTDKNKWPKYLNCDDPSLSTIDDLRLFPYFKSPSISAVPVVGGRVDAGTYYVAVGYERNDGTSTTYSPVSNFITIAPLNGVQGTTDKAIEITITDADTSFDSMRIAIISKISGKTKAVEITEFIPVTGGSITYLYTGDNLTTDIDITDVIVHPAEYNKVGTIGQLNDALYIGELEAEPDLNDMQIFANMVKLEWQSELLDAVNPPEDHVNGTRKGMMHQEVYAVYLRYRKVRGGTTKWFHIPGNTPSSFDLTNSTESIAGGGATIPRFKVEDTIPYFNRATLSGGTGVWQNDTEVYPNTVDFDSTGLGGPDLRGTKVCHHRMPSIRWCKDNLYQTEDRYGKSHLDILGLRANNVRIPSKYINKISGYELGYAKRTIGNMTIYGQSVLMHGADDTITAIPIYTTGGNFNSEARGRTGDDYGQLAIRKDTFRFHSFDLLFNKPSIEPSFVSAQLRMRKDNIEYLEDGEANEDEGGGKRPLIHLIDYTTGVTPQHILPGRRLRKINKSFYLTVDVNANDFVNLRHENTFAGFLAGANWDLNTGMSTFRIFNQYTEVNYGSPGYEEAYLVNMIGVKADLYSSVFSQNLVSCGTAKALTDNTPFWGGDVFVADYTFHTYGRHNKNDDGGSGYLGTKVIRRFICESISNINLRYEITGNEYSKWWPHNGVVANSPAQTYISTFDRSKDPNQFGYSKDFNALNDLVQSVIYSPYREELTVFPYRVHRGGKLSRQARPRNWRTFLPLDYYECQKNMGRMINIEGMSDRLLIHFENALMLTQDKTTLDGGQLSVTLGSGDIFQFEPQPAQESKLGIGGTIHDLACRVTPEGYVFPDAKQGEMFLYGAKTVPGMGVKQQLQNISGGINTFIREYLKIKDKNVFTGNGITIGWDQKYKRILLTVKNKTTASLAMVPKIYSNTPAFWNSLTVGDIINYFGRLVEYKGVNDDPVYECPVDVIPDLISWEPSGPVCQSDNGNNTGIKVWITRARKVNEVLDGYVEANDPTSGLGTYFPPVTDLIYCPLPAPVTTWKGIEGVCQGTSFSCPDGYTLSADQTTCTKNETSAPTVSSSAIGVVPSQVPTTYSGNGSRLYQAGYNTSLFGVSYDLLTSLYWREQVDQLVGPMNRLGVWVDTNNDGIKDSLVAGTVLEFTKQIISSANETVYIGVGGDNTFRIDLNGVTIVDCNGTDKIPAGDTDERIPFTYFHLFPVSLPQGSNLLSFKGVGDGSVNDSLAVAIYRNTPEQIAAATSDSDLTIIFKTTDLIGTPIDIATCSPGWILDTTGGSGNYVCKRTVTVPPNIANTGVISFNTRCRYQNGIPDGYCETNSPGANYVQPIVDTAICPVPVTGLLCGANISETFTGDTLHVYDQQQITIYGTKVNIGWESFDRPNRFTVKKDGAILYSTGWVGYANYSGPWGSTLNQTAESGLIEYIPENGHTYTIQVEAGPADPSNSLTDTYRYTIGCG